MQVGASPQYTLAEVAENLTRMDQALFEGFVTRDPLGLYIVGPPDTRRTSRLLQRSASARIRHVPDREVRRHRDRRRQEYQRRSGDGRVPGFDHRLPRDQQEFPCIRNAQRYIGAMVRMGFSQDQIRVVVNHYTKKIGPNHASLEQIQQTLNQPVFYGIPDSPALLAAINKARPLVADRQAAPELDRLFRAFVDKATGVKTPKSNTVVMGKTA